MMDREEGAAAAWGTQPALLTPLQHFPPYPKPQPEATQGLGSKALKCLLSLALN